MLAKLQNLLPYSPQATECGALIRAARIEAGLSQGQLAHRVGIDRSDLSRIENGRRLPWPGELAKLQMVLQLEPSCDQSAMPVEPTR